MAEVDYKSSQTLPDRGSILFHLQNLHCVSGYKSYLDNTLGGSLFISGLMDLLSENHDKTGMKKKEAC